MGNLNLGGANTPKKMMDLFESEGEIYYDDAFLVTKKFVRLMGIVGPDKQGAYPVDDLCGVSYRKNGRLGVYAFLAILGAVSALFSAYIFSVVFVAIIFLMEKYKERSATISFFIGST